MLTKKTQSKIQKAYDAMLANGMNRRPGQLAMINEVARTLALGSGEGAADNRISLINAPTGVGKSFGYLLPGILLANELKLPLIVATSSVALQKQLITKDAPMAAEALGLSPKIALAVGQGRYACPVKIEEALGEGANYSLVDAPTFSTEHLATLNGVYQEISSGKWDARFDSKPDLPPAVVSAIKVGAGDCKGNDCPLFGRCSFSEDRLKIKKSDVIITNHDLLLSSVFRGKVLPAPDESLIVIDEGHLFPYAALNGSAVDVSFAQVSDKLDYLVKALPQSAKERKELTQLVQEMRKLLGEIERQSFVYLDGKETARFHWAGVSEHFQPLAQSGLALSTDLLQMASRCHEECKEDRIEASARMFEACDHLHRFFTGFSARSVEQYPPQANWFSMTGKTVKGNTSCTVPSRPLLHIWRKAKAVVITSATLKDSRGFHFFKKFSGIRACNELDLESPFDHQRQAKIIIPKIKAKPDTGEFFAEAGNWLSAAIERVTNGGLVLFSSRAQMAAMLGALPVSIRKLVLVQGDAPIEELLSKHRKSVNDGKRSILAGLLSFGTGLDLPGKECELLVIVKIPFASPDNPVDATLSSWLEDNKRSPFMELALPRTSIILQQWVGRLIRKENDHGMVMILDRRLVEKRYGKVLLDALPKMPIEQPITPDALSFGHIQQSLVS